MKKCVVLSLYDEYFDSILNKGIFAKAIKNGILDFYSLNIRDFKPQHNNIRADDTTYGGGSGMLLRVDVLYYAIVSIINKYFNNNIKNLKFIFFSPRGKKLTNSLVVQYSKDTEYLFLCGHYEGVDSRVFQIFPFEEISIGDYIISSGCPALIVFLDSILRYEKNILGNKDSTSYETFSDGCNGLLEYDQYSKPNKFLGLSVPEILLSGNHKKILKWRQLNSLSRTKECRKDLCNEIIKRN